MNLGPVESILDKMGVDPEEMDRLNTEMKSMFDEMGDDFDLGESIDLLRQELGGDADIISLTEADDSEEAQEDDQEVSDDSDNTKEENNTPDSEEKMSRSIQRNPFEFMSRFMNSNSESQSGEPGKAGPRRTKEKKNSKKILFFDGYLIQFPEKFMG